MSKNLISKRVFPLLVLLLTSYFLFHTSCKKDEIINDASAKLKFSSDSILFDTVFTSIGSTTKHLKLYNTYNKTLKISSIRLAGGSSSLFSININGAYATSATNIEIAAKDSLFIFVKVTINPNNKNNPLIVTDSIMFLTNGNEQKVKLAAWGQDAHFIVANKRIKGLPDYKIVANEHENITWENDKPYVVYGFAVVDSTGSLTINEGVQVHFYNNSGLWIYKGGSLKVKGTMAKPVVFQGTRLEADYKDIPGQWDRIWLNEGSVDNEINYAVIKNAFIGIQAEILDQKMGNELLLTNTIIENCSGFGILARNYIIDAGNCVVANCGQYAIALTRGGKYDFRHCTLGNYWNYSVRQTPSLVLNNYYDDANKVRYVYKLEKAYFGNCIFYGNINDEYVPDSVPKTQSTFNYQFERCILKTTLKTTSSRYIYVQKNDPMFSDYNKNNYQLMKGSPAINFGSYSIITGSNIQDFIKTDINGNARTEGKTDLGAYQTK